MEVSVHKVRYQKQWRRFTKKVKRGLLLMQLFQLQVDEGEWLLPFDWDDVTRDYRPVAGDIKAKADQGVGQRAAVIDGAAEQRRQWKHDEVDHFVADRGAIDIAHRMIDTVGVDAALEWAGYYCFGEPEGEIELDISRAEVTDLMSMRLDIQPANLSCVPIGDLFGEQLHWKTTGIEKLDDGSLVVWKKQGREWHAIHGVLHGQQVRLQRWADQRGDELNGIEAPKVTRATLNEYSSQRNAERKETAIAQAMAEAVELVLMDQVPDPSVVGRGRPKWLWVCLSALGSLHVSKTTDAWRGKCKVDSAVLAAAESAVTAKLNK